MPVVHISGGNADEWAVDGVPQSILITKPFAPAQIVTAVSQALNDVPLANDVPHESASEAT